MKAFRSPLPQNRFRTIASAQTIPKTVFTGHGDRRDDQRQLEGVDRLGRRERVPRRRRVLERPPEDDGERADEDHREVGERDRAEAEAGDDAPHRSCLVAKWRMTPIETSVRKEIARSTTATADAPAGSPLSIRP